WARGSRFGSAAQGPPACGILLSRFRFARHYRPLTCCSPVRQTPTFGLSRLVAVECGPRLLSDRVPQTFRSRPQLGVELHYLRTRQPPHYWPVCAPGGYTSVAASRASFESKLKFYCLVIVRGDVRMEMHQVRYFLAVARTLTFTRASEEGHVARPSPTRAIKLLYIALDCARIVHGGNGVAVGSRDSVGQCFRCCINAMQAQRAPVRLPP